MTITRNISLVDTTLRDGEQAPGVCFSPSLKVEILKMLYNAGIREFEIGTPAIGSNEQNAIRKMLALNLDANLSVWCRATLADLKLAKEVGAKRVNLSLPVSLKQINAIGKSKEWVLQQLQTCLKYASHNFEMIAVGAQDGSRAEPDFLYQYIETAMVYPKVERIRIADTVGIMNPFSVYDLLHDLTRKYNEVEFEFHGHNDLGMANANGLAAIKGGANLVSVTINGLGERCGNTPLEELLIALEYSQGIKLDLNKKQIRNICDTISILSGQKIPASKPFSGELCFTHESGIHTRSLIVDKLSYQPFCPEDIGAKTKFVFGKHSGKAAIKAVLNIKGIHPIAHEIDQILDQIKTNSKYSSSGFSEKDVFDLYMKHFIKPIRTVSVCKNLNLINGF